MFDIEKINWELGFPFVPGGQMGGVMAIRTIAINAGYEDIVQSYYPNIQPGGRITVEDLENLESLLLESINEYVQAQNQELLLSIAVGISLWGGRAGRFAFNGNINPAGWLANRHEFDFHNYGLLVNAILVENIAEAIHLCGYLPRLGVAFCTKHFSFWTRENGATKFPIYDRVMANGLYHENASWANYENYLIWMQEATDHVNMLNPHFQGGFTIHMLERQLFNFFQTH